MSDLVRTERGRPPWLPADGSTLIEDLHRYDAPLDGVLRQEGVDFLFRCISGEVDDYSLWAYSIITEPELASLRGTEGPDALDGVEADIWQDSRPMTVVFVAADGIVERVNVDGPLVAERLQSAIAELADAVDRQLGEVKGGLRRAAEALSVP